MRKHGFSHTHIDLHEDGSATIHHTHESGDPTKDIHHAVGDLDSLHDSLQDHLNQEDYKEAEAAEEKVSPGIHQKIAALGHPEPSY